MSPVNPDRLAIIQRSIDKFGFHTIAVAAQQSPRFLYTIGNMTRVGQELVLAGGAYYQSAGEAGTIINLVAEKLTAIREIDGVFELPPFGMFSLRSVDSSWIKALLLGAVDYYQGRTVRATQVVPHTQLTVDVPRMDVEMTSEGAPVWKWELEPWTLSIPKNSVVVTNLAALRGGRITEVVRWELDQWEMFSGSGADTLKEDIRIVPIGVLTGSDPSLEVAYSLATGMGLWRDADQGDWHAWKSARA